MSFSLNQLLEFSAGAGNVEKIRERVSLGADPASSNALLIAAGKGHIEALEVLLELGANINATDSSGQGALEYALYHRKPEAIRFLLSRGAVLAHHSRPHWKEQLAEFHKSQQA